jgi:hypothetical protein
MTSPSTAEPGEVVEPAAIRELLPGMRALLVVAAVLVFLAGVQLFVLTGRTDRYFAWTISPPLTAAFLGGAYWSAVAFEAMAARARSWAEARIAVPSVFVFTTLTLVATVLHVDKFHLGGEFEAGTQAVTWAWIAVYAVVPVLMVVLYLRQQLLPGGDPPRAVRLPGRLRAVVAVQAVVLLGFGGWLFVAPASAAELWPWSLTPLTARAIAAWMLGLGVAAAQALWEDCARRLRPAAVAYLAFGALEGVALLRHLDIPSWDEVSSWLYVAFLASTLVTGAVTLALAGAGGRRARPAPGT